VSARASAGDALELLAHMDRRRSGVELDVAPAKPEHLTAA